MKIKEVCNRTGLTDRTIRFYIEKGLLKTNSHTVNGRTSRDYTEEDISILMDISNLRKAGFSIQDILDMQNPDNDINTIIARHCEKLEKEQAFCEHIIQELKEINKRRKMPWRKLATILFQERSSIDNNIIHWPQESVPISEKPPKKSAKKYLLLGLSAFVTLAIGIFCVTALRKGALYRQERVTSFFISDVIIEKKWYEDSQYYVTLHSTFENGSFGADEYFEFSRTLPVATSELYHSLVVQGPTYTSASIYFSISYGEADDLGLLDESGMLLPEKVAEVILSDMSMIKKYCSLTQIDAGGETQIYTYP